MPDTDQEKRLELAVPIAVYNMGKRFPVIENLPYRTGGILERT